MTELLDWIDEQGNVITAIPKKEAYEKQRIINIVHTFVIEPENGKIFLQKRAPHVLYKPNCWCTSAGGHVRAGEQIDVAAKRELAEEIGIETTPQYLEKIQYKHHNGHVMHLHIYATITDEKVYFTDGEVSEGEYFSLEEIDTLLTQGEFIHPQLPPTIETLKEHYESLLRSARRT